MHSSEKGIPKERGDVGRTQKSDPLSTQRSATQVIRGHPLHSVRSFLPTRRTTLEKSRGLVLVGSTAVLLDTTCGGLRIQFVAGHVIDSSSLARLRSGISFDHSIVG